MSNLLEKASILLTPTAYDDGKILSVKPEPSLGSELITNGDFATDTDWTKGTGWTIGGGVATANNVPNLQRLQQGLGTSIIGSKYKYSINISNVSGFYSVYIFGVYVLATSNTEGIIEGEFTATSTNGAFWVAGASASGLISATIDNVSVKEAIDGDFDFTRNSSATRVNSQGLIEDMQILSGNLVSNGDFSQEGSQLVTNGDFSQEGSEEITNGDFSNGSTDWELNPSSGTAIVSNGKLNFTNSTSQGTQVQQRDRSYVIGKTYKITFTVTDYIQGGVRLSLGNNLTTSVSANGTFTQYITYTSGLNRTYIYTNGSTLSIDNVSVKEVGQDWTLGTGWSIGTNKVIGDGTMGGNDVVRQIINFSQGTTYRFSFTVLDYISGGVFIRNPFNGYLDIASANGSYSFDYVAGINDYIDFRGNSFVGSITNVSVKEVGQDWTLGTGVTIGENKAIFTSTASGQSVSQNAVASSLTNGALAKVSFEVLSRTQGSFGVYFSGTLVGTLASAGVFTGYFTKGTETSFYIRALGTTSGSISNISVIEITDDTNLPRINYEGFSYQDALGSELVVNGDFATDSNWFKDANWTIANGKATSTGGGRMFQSIPFLETNIGTTVKVSFDIIDVTANGVVVNCYGGVSQLFTTVGTHTFTTTTTNNTNLYFNNAGAGNLIGSIDNVSVKEVLGQEVVPDSGCGSWLFEPQSTNLIPNANQYFGNTVYYTVTPNQSSPDGENNATLFVEKTVTAFYSVTSDTASIVGGQTYAYSFFVKYAGKQNITVNSSDGISGFNANIDILNGTVNSGTAEIKDFGNGWFRVLMTRTVAASASNAKILFNFGNQTGDGVSGFYLFGYQIEQQSFATSYIPTNGSTVTRLQDAAFGAGSSDLINSTEGVLYAEMAALANDLTNKQISLNNGTTDDRIQLYYSASSNQISVFYKSQSGATAFILNHTLSDITQFNKVAFKWKQNDFALWSSGVEVATQTSGVTSSADTLTKLDFQQFNGSADFFGKTKCVAVFKEALTDAELTCLTTI